MLDLLAGYRRVGAVVPLTVGGNAGALPIMTNSAFAGMVGTKTMVIRRLKIRSNNPGADTWVHIGTGAAGAVVDIMPALRIVNNTTDDYEEGDLPAVQTNLQIMAFADAIGANNIDVQIEVEERG